ncbi:hypothetical protein IMZ48_35235 [Candidatus Bathyarchaeota archaeon]|nr:hypothetical protein [Candidatus Bathyarchaeota archaeon]
MAQPPPPDPANPFAPPPPPPLDTLDPDWVAEDKGPGIIATMVTVVSIATIFTAGRLYVRGRIKRRFQFDDYIIVLALVRPIHSSVH